MTRIRRRRVVGVLEMPGLRDRALADGWCIYSGYVQLELTRTITSYSRVSTALSFARTVCMVKGKV